MRPYYLMVPAIAGRTEFTDVYEPDDLAEEAVSDGGDAFVVGAVLHPARDVVQRAVAVLRANHQLLLGAGFEGRAFWIDLERDNLLVFERGRRRTGCDPFGDDAVLQRIRLEPHATFATRTRW